MLMIMLFTMRLKDHFIYIWAGGHPLPVPGADPGGGGGRARVPYPPPIFRV